MITKDGKRVPNDFVNQLKEVIQEAGWWVVFMEILRKATATKCQLSQKS